MSEPLTAQLITNFTSERVEQVADSEAALRAYEWLVARWSRT